MYSSDPSSNRVDWGQVNSAVQNFQAIQAQEQMRQIAARKQSRAFARQQRINQLIGGGAKPDEAFIAAATEFSDDPGESLAYLNAAKAFREASAPRPVDPNTLPMPEVIENDGQQYMLNYDKMGLATLRPGPRQPSLPAAACHGMNEPSDLITRSDQLGNQYYWKNNAWVRASGPPKIPDTGPVGLREVTDPYGNVIPNKYGTKGSGVVTAVPAAVSEAENQVKTAQKALEKALLPTQKTEAQKNLRLAQMALDAARRQGFGQGTVSGAARGTVTVPTPAVTPANPYKVGAVYNGLKYKGGDPNIEDNWEKVR